jgi:hypothetical protein
MCAESDRSGDGSTEIPPTDGVLAPPTPTLAHALGLRCLRHGDWITWALGAVLAVGVLERLNAPRTFWFDEWSFVIGRRDWSVDQFLQPHNGHLSLIPVSVYKTLFAVFGLDHYRPYRVLGLLVHASVATCTFAYARSRIGSLGGGALGLIVLFLGAGWQNIFWPFQMGTMGSVAFGVGAWLLLDRSGGRSGWLAAACLGASLACTGTGIPFLGGTVVRLAAERRWARLGEATAPPAALYAVWYFAFGEDQGHADDLSLIPRFVVDVAASALNGLAGKGLQEGRMGVAVFVLGAATIVISTRNVRAAALGPATALSLSLLLIAYSRAELGEPDASRYTYVNGVLIVLLASDLVRPLVTVGVEWLLACTALLCLWGSWGILHAGAGGLRDASATTRVALRAVEWAGDPEDPTFRPDPFRMPAVEADEYLDAVEDLGSAAAADAEVLGASEPDRALADDVSLRTMGVALEPSGPVTASAELPGDGRTVSAGTGCATANPAAGDLTNLTVLLPSGAPIAFDSASTIEIRLRRYAEEFPEAAFAVTSATEPATLTVPADEAPIQTWVVELTGAAAIAVCGIGP